MRGNRTGSCPFEVTKKDKRATFDYKSDGTVIFANWKDNSIGTGGTNFSSVLPVTKISRWVKGEGKVLVDQTKLRGEYNKGMGEVDLLDMLLGSNRPKASTKKMVVATFFKCIKHCSGRSIHSL